MKYLIYCGPGIGDWILILPMARRIKKADPMAHITAFVASSKQRFALNRTLLTLQEDIDDINYYSAKEIAHIPTFLACVGIKKYDYGFVLQYTNNESTSEWPSRIVHLACKKTCGIQLTAKSNVHYDYEIPRQDGVRIVDYPMLMLDAVGIGENLQVDVNNLLRKDQISKQSKSLKLEPEKQNYIALVVGTAPVGGKLQGKKVSNPSKNWEYGKWLKLAEYFKANDYRVLLLGGAKEEQELAACGMQDGIDGIMNLTGKCNIVQSLSALCCAKIVIGADTGLMHCAGALGIPTLTLFGCTDYREYLPFGKNSNYLTADLTCSPCFGTNKAISCRTIECMKCISVEQVFEKAKHILKN